MVKNQINLDSIKMQDSLKKAGELRADLLQGKFNIRTSTTTEDKESGKVTTTTTKTPQKLTDVLSANTLKVMAEVQKSVPDGQYVLWTQKNIRAVQKELKQIN